MKVVVDPVSIRTGPFHCPIFAWMIGHRRVESNDWANTEWGMVELRSIPT